MASVFPLVLAGHVDHGKSTLLGRLLFETNALPEEKIRRVEAQCNDAGKSFEYAYLLDALEEEQKQGLTIDTSTISFSTDTRDYMIIDAPGHKQFLKNMISGATRADAAVLLVDVAAGVQEQTKRHAHLISLLAIPHVIVVCNKMDLIQYSEKAFLAVKEELEAYLSQLNTSVVHWIPISASQGDMVCSRGDSLSWYAGPTVLEALHDLPQGTDETHAPLRFPIQDVYKFDDRRIIAGRIETGSLRVGDAIQLLPSLHKAKVLSIEGWPAGSDHADSGRCVGITVDDEFFYPRGELITHLDNLPSTATTIAAHVFWMSQETLDPKKKYHLRLATQDVACSIQEIRHVIDTDTLAQKKTTSFSQNDVGELIVRLQKPLVFDRFVDIPVMGRFALSDGDHICAGGIIVDSQEMADKSPNVVWQDLAVSKKDRSTLLGFNNKVLWFTGLSSAGKSTIAQGLAQQLHAQGILTYVLDGDNIRHGLNKDLGFSPHDRVENIRRIAEVAKLLHDAGIVVIVSFISPYKADRKRARELIGNDFVEVFVDCPLAVCEKRDPKGLYKKARKGEIKDFTGIDAPYEKPLSPEIHIDTSSKDPTASIEHIFAYLQEALHD